MPICGKKDENYNFRLWRNVDFKRDVEISSCSVSVRYSCTNVRTENDIVCLRAFSQYFL